MQPDEYTVASEFSVVNYTLIQWNYGKDNIFKKHFKHLIKQLLKSLFIYFWLHLVFVAASGGDSSLRCAGFSLQWLLIAVASLVAELGL